MKKKMNRKNSKMKRSYVKNDKCKEKARNVLSHFQSAGRKNMRNNRITMQKGSNVTRIKL